MIICHSRKFVFFSNPKTGSESLRRLLAPWSEEQIVPWVDLSEQTPFYPHMPPEEAEAVFTARGWRFDDYLRMTCVRNPYPRLVSLYRMICDADGLWRLRRQLWLGRPGFARWLRGTRPDGPGGGGRPHQRWRRYGTWSAQAWCAGRITHTLRLEHLEEDIAPVLAELGIAPGSIPHLNARGCDDWADWYDPASRDLVARRYAWDLAQFGYRAPALRRAA